MSPTDLQGPATHLTPDLKRIIERAGDTPPTLVDPDTKAAYVLLRVEEYDRLLSVEESDVDALFPLIAESFGPEGWDDPAMDVYNDLDPRKAADAR